MGRWPPFFEPRGKLAGGGGFAGALEAGHKDDGGRLRGEFEAGRVFAERVMSSSRTILMTARRRKGGEDFIPTALTRICSIRVADDVEVDVGFKQGYADFAQGFGDVLSVSVP